MGQAVWLRWAGLSAFQGQPSLVGLIQGRAREQRATVELLLALRVLLAQKSRVRLVLRVDSLARLVRVSRLPELFL